MLNALGLQNVELCNDRLAAFSDMQNSMEGVAVRDFTSDEGWGFTVGARIIIVDRNVSADDTVRGFPIVQQQQNSPNGLSKPPRTLVNIPLSAVHVRDEGKSPNAKLEVFAVGRSQASDLMQGHPN